MSHDGFQIVSEEEARRRDAAEIPLPRAATEPAKVKVHKTEGSGVEITWRDGHHSQWNFLWLRHACPCATCVEQRNAEKRLPGIPPPEPASLLPMYKAPVRPTDVRQVGRYALAFDWNDGHTSGIYSWDYLRRNCACEICKASPATA